MASTAEKTSRFPGAYSQRSTHSDRISVPDLQSPPPRRGKAAVEAVDPAPGVGRDRKSTPVGHLRAHSEPLRQLSERPKSGVVAKRKRRSTKGFDAED